MIESLSILRQDTSQSSGNTLGIGSGRSDSVAGREFSFFDILDMINPLQHIPIVNTAYRALTGDQINPVARLVGGTLFGGGIGAAGALATIVVEQETGSDIGENALTILQGGDAKVAERSIEEGALAHLDNPEHQLAEAQKVAYEALPASLLGFADTSYHQENLPPPSKAEVADLSHRAAFLHERKDRYND